MARVTAGTKAIQARVGRGRGRAPLGTSAPAASSLLLDEALAKNLARVTEVSESGSVPELAFENGSPEKILLVDGDELIGARQNRAVNITILVGAGKKLVIPVSCVEQGRWADRGLRDQLGRRSSFIEMPTLTISGAPKNPATSAETSIRGNWNRYTACAVANCTRLGGCTSPFPNAGRVSVSQPTTLSCRMSSTARSRSRGVATSNTSPS
jgi:hypothetical protein